MGKTEIAVGLLLANNSEKADISAKDLLQLNTERKERTKRNLYKVEEYFKRKPQRTEERIIFAMNQIWNPEFLGLWQLS